MLRQVTLGAVMMGVGCLAAVAEEGFVREDQSPTGKFLTAGEVRPILEATRGNWIVVREYEGQDLLYFTHLLSWRCGLHQIRFGINGGLMQVFEMPPCDPEGPSPMAIPSGTLIYQSYPLGSIETIDIEVLYDDLGTATGQYVRKAVQIP